MNTGITPNIAALAADRNVHGRRLGWLPAVFLAASAASSAATYSPPVSNLPGGSLAGWAANAPGGTGIPGGIPVRTAIVNMTGGAFPYNCDPTDTTDCAPAIIAAVIANAGTGNVLYFPAGRYYVSGSGGALFGKGGFTIRGAGDSTVFDSHSNNGCGMFYLGSNPGLGYGGCSAAITGGMSQGSTTLTVSSSSVFAVGMLVQIQEQNDPTIPVVDVAGYDNVQQQKTSIVSIPDSTHVTISTPLYWTLKNGLNPTLWGTYWTVFQASGIGLEDFKIDASNATAGPQLYLQQVLSSWITNVHIYNSPSYHVYLIDCFQIEMDHDWLDMLNHSGPGGAGLLIEHTSASLFQDCIINHAFPLVEMNFGSSGNVFGYCFGYDSTSYGVVGAAFDDNHGPENAFNLVEGCIWPNVETDGYYGGAIAQTYFRNWLYGTSPGASPLSRQAMILNRFTRQASVVGNLFGNLSTSTDPNLPNFPGWYGEEGGIATGPYLLGHPNIGNTGFSGTVQPSAGVYWADWLMSGSVTSGGSTTSGTIAVSSGSIGDWESNFGGSGPNSTVLWWTGGFGFVTSSSGSGTTINVTTASNLPANGTTLRLFAGTNGFQEEDLDVQANSTLMANWDLFNVRQPTEDSDLSVGTALPNSLYLASAPSWLSGFAWPAVATSNHAPVSADINPAAYRFWNGAAPVVSYPTFGSQLQTFDIYGYGSSSYVITLTSPVATGQRLVLLAGDFERTNAIIRATDSKGNTYVVHVGSQVVACTGLAIGIASANVTAPLVPGDTITLTLSYPSEEYVAGAVAQLNNCAAAGQPDSLAEADGASSTISVPGTTLSDHTAIIGIMGECSGTSTGSPNWALISPAPIASWGINLECFYINATSSGAQNPVIPTAAVVWGAAWVAYH
jgi:hypothetical protein